MYDLNESELLDINGGIGFIGATLIIVGGVFVVGAITGALDAHNQKQQP